MEKINEILKKLHRSNFTKDFNKIQRNSDINFEKFWRKFERKNFENLKGISEKF